MGSDNEYEMQCEWNRDVFTKDNVMDLMAILAEGKELPFDKIIIFNP